MKHLLELIDTLWNVNFCWIVLFVPANPELIDTLWNVNITIPEFLSTEKGINRYIMECK